MRQPGFGTARKKTNIVIVLALPVAKGTGACLGMRRGCVASMAKNLGRVAQHWNLKQRVFGSQYPPSMFGWRLTVGEIVDVD